MLEYVNIHPRVCPAYLYAARILMLVQGLKNSEVCIDGVEILILVMEQYPGWCVRIVLSLFDVVVQAKVEGLKLLFLPSSTTARDAGVKICRVR